MNFHKDILILDAAAETDRIVAGLRHVARAVMRRHGAVVGISGGIDSALVLALGVKAFGPEKIVALMLPEKDSDPLSEEFARELAAKYGVTPIREDIAPALEGYGCYRRRDEAIKRVFPEYEAKLGYKAKIVLPQNLLNSDAMNVFSVTIIAPDGTESSKPLPAPDYLQIVAASNLKQRTRMSMLFYHAELRNYAVLGTANKNEHDQGFFVKFGDSGVDIQTIGHLYKTQVYQLSRHLGVPESILKRTPTTDTYSAPCSQEEFFFRMPFTTMDLLWYALEHGISAAEAGPVMGLTETQVQRAYTDIGRKQRATEPLRMPPVDLVATAK